MITGLIVGVVVGVAVRDPERFLDDPSKVSDSDAIPTVVRGSVEFDFKRAEVR
jgi:hypothetical protein